MQLNNQVGLNKKYFNNIFEGTILFIALVLPLEYIIPHVNFCGSYYASFPCSAMVRGNFTGGIPFRSENAMLR